MGLGPNNFPHVVTTTTTIMIISVQFKTPTLQMGPYYNASWHVGGGGYMHNMVVHFLKQ